MPNLNIAVLGSPGYTRELGKKGTETDITLYNTKKGETTLTIIEASKYPEKLQSLFYSVGFADFVVLVVEEINASFGETVLMLNCLDQKDGVIVLRNYITEGQLKRFIKSTVVENYGVMDDDLPKLRALLMAKAESIILAESSKTGGVVIDHSFNVKGIGAVALGVVRWGQIHKHDKLTAMPNDAVAQVRSIQKHDDDFDTAEIGDRVGLALKNVEVDQLQRGIVLTNDVQVRQTELIEGNLKLVKYWVNPLDVGMAIHVGLGMQFISAKIESKKDNKVSINLQHSLVFRENDIATVMYLNGGNLRVVGSVQL